MMKFIRKIVILLAFALAGAPALHAQRYSISGSVTDRSGNPIEFATIIIDGTEQWAVADAKGNFIINNVPAIKTRISVSCLGYVTDTREITIRKEIKNYKIALAEDNLSLDSAIVTAQDNSNSATTTRTIDKTALDHVQLTNVYDISSLLPGGSTVNASLTDEQRFSIRSGPSSEKGNVSFTTAVEVDGVRLSSNASFSGMTSSNESLKGVTTNNIASSNVESVEVITGVPSVEYGDMTSGVVKINTRKGKTPWTVTATTNPKTKMISLSKGFGLGENAKGVSRGVLNASYENARSVSDQMSPYTSYKRNQLNFTYSNIFNKGIFENQPLRLTAGITGNLGGLDSSADPDSFLETYTKTHDNAIRGNLSLNWLLSKPWITNLEFNGAVSYSDKYSESNTNYSKSFSTISLHGTEEGYFIAQSYEDNPNAAAIIIPRGYWYNTMCMDDKPLTYKLTLKANWAKNFGKVNNKFKIGSDWTSDRNLGKGEYSKDISTAPTYREYPFCDMPAMNNLSFYAEDNIMIPIGKTKLNLIAGVRNDNTIINGSEYGTTSSFSPRFNARYIIRNEKDHRKDFLRDMSFRASYGLAVKQPSFYVLYPQPSYRDLEVFTSPTDAAGNSFIAYQITPRTIEYNSALRWQKSRQSEIGADFNLAGNRISLSAFWNTTLDSYYINTCYTSNTYMYTATDVAQVCPIPADRRVYSIDRTTGAVTVADRTGALAPEQLAGISKTEALYGKKPENASYPITRYGVEWIIDFKRIDPINTDIRLDGTYYGYRYVSSDIVASSPNNVTSTDKTPYKYIGYYYGGTGISNGSETKTIRNNLTITTHIPKIRMIVSLKIESTLMQYSRSLSDRPEGQRTYVISDKNDTFSITGESVYDGEHYTILYPDYYVSVLDGSTNNFAERYNWAKANQGTPEGRDLLLDLRKLITTNEFVYTFMKDYISPYFAANISVTKEIKDIASISFYANNFFNNMSQIYSTKTGLWSSVESRIPKFYYGMTLRLKF